MTRPEAVGLVTALLWLGALWLVVLIASKLAQG